MDLCDNPTVQQHCAMSCVAIILQSVVRLSCADKNCIVSHVYCKLMSCRIVTGNKHFTDTTAVITLFIVV